MLFVEKHTASFGNFLGWRHQTLYSIFHCEFQLWELKEVCWCEMWWAWRVVGWVCWLCEKVV